MKHERVLVFMRFAMSLATLSKCSDGHVAAVLTNADGTKIYSMGINGGPKGGVQCLCELGDKYTCVHAEANAVAQCNATDDNMCAFCTLAPCITCAAIMLNKGVKTVYWHKSYKDNLGIELLRANGAECIQVNQMEDADGDSD